MAPASAPGRATHAPEAASEIGRPPISPSRYIPAPVRRQVWERDGGRCTFVDGDGHRCGERPWLELDHIVPFARGGPSTADNLRIACRMHNQHAARRAFGAGFIAMRVHEARGG